MSRQLIRAGLGLRVVARGDEFGERLIDDEGHGLASASFTRRAVTDGVLVVTPEGCQFFSMYAVRRLLDYAEQERSERQGAGAKESGAQDDPTHI